MVAHNENEIAKKHINMHEYEFSRNLRIVSISNYSRSAAAANRGSTHHLVMLFPRAIRGPSEMGFCIMVSDEACCNLSDPNISIVCGAQFYSTYS